MVTQFTLNTEMYTVKDGSRSHTERWIILFRTEQI